MIAKLTEIMVSIEGENMRPVTWVVIEEVTSGEWGIGGNALTTDGVKALAAGTPVGWHRRAGTRARPARSRTDP